MTCEPVKDNVTKRENNSNDMFRPCSHYHNNSSLSSTHLTNLMSDVSGKELWISGKIVDSARGLSGQRNKASGRLYNKFITENNGGTEPIYPPARGGLHFEPPKEKI